MTIPPDPRPWPATPYSKLLDLRAEKREERIASLKRKSIRTRVRERQKLLDDLLRMLAAVDPSHPYLNACVSLVKQCVPDVFFPVPDYWLEGGIEWIAGEIKAAAGAPSQPGLGVALKRGRHGAQQDDAALGGHRVVQAAGRSRQRRRALVRVAR
jgi:hypothetical protein